MTTTDKRPELPLVQSTAPERIFLAVAEEEEYRDHPFPDANNDEVCWSVDQPLAVCVPYIRADIAACEACGRASAQPTEPARVTEELVEACKKLKSLVEGAPMRRWVDQNGERLKDQPEWVRFFNALTVALRAREG